MTSRFMERTSPRWAGRFSASRLSLDRGRCAHPLAERALCGVSMFSVFIKQCLQDFKIVKGIFFLRFKAFLFCEPPSDARSVFSKWNARSQLSWPSDAMVHGGAEKATCSGSGAALRGALCFWVGGGSRAPASHGAACPGRGPSPRISTL